MPPPPGLSAIISRPDIPRKVPGLLVSSAKYQVGATVTQWEDTRDPPLPKPDERCSAKQPPCIPIGQQRYPTASDTIRLVFKPPPPLPQ